MLLTPPNPPVDGNPIQFLFTRDVTPNNVSMWIDRNIFLNHCIQVVSPSGGTASIYASLDGVNWNVVPDCANLADGAMVQVYGVYRRLCAVRSNDAHPVSVIVVSHQTGR